MRTPLFSALRGLVRDVAHQVDAESARPAVSRRAVVKGSLAAGAGMAGLGLAGPVSAAPAQVGARIVVIGAGLAGLTAAYQLRKAGRMATVYEASDRVGGRCWTNRTWADGQVSEHGGEFIDTGHREIRALVGELGLTLEDRTAAVPAGTRPRYFFGGAFYPYADAVRDLRALYPQARNDANTAGYPTLYNRSTARGRQLDRMSIRDWIAAYVPGGVTSRLGRLLDVAYTIEYGAESGRQSALNLVYLFGYNTATAPTLFGESDERYHVAGGNDRIVAGLQARLPGQIVRSTALTALAARTDGTYAVTLTSGGTTSTVVADRVILALPFSVLRDVDLAGANFPALKRQAISQLPMGANTKLSLQFSRRGWYDLGCDGETYADTGYQATWDTTLGQGGPTGILTDYTGGDIALGFGPGRSPAQYAARFLGQLDPVLPGVGGTWTGAVDLNYWPGDPWTRGSYSYWGVGQYTTFAGVEREPAGGCHFAGEHTSVDYQGYLNGAVESGQRAAAEVIAALRK